MNSLSPDFKRSDRSSFEIALLPGDGVGPEVTAEAVKVVDAAIARVGGVEIVYTEICVGVEAYRRSGDPLPEATLEKLKKFDAILLGAMGLPDVRWPDGLEMTPQIDLRERLDLYAGLRPIYLFHGEDTPLRDRAAGDIDFLLVRESTEGLFAGRKVKQDLSADQAEDRMLITRRGSERVTRAAFQQAMGRRKHLTLIDKANVLPSTALFRKVFDEVSADFPAVKTSRIYVDAAALYLVQRPEVFDVIVTENMFGDILSDLAAALVGGMGMAPSADVGDVYAVFQPSHGSAPDIAGQGIANPVATILSAAMMLDWLGSAPARQAAELIRCATRTVLEDRQARTCDMGGALTTREMGAAVVEALALDGVAHARGSTR